MTQGVIRGKDDRWPGRPAALRSAFAALVGQVSFS